MSDQFFEQPILNSPYECPSKHWELDETGQPTQRIIESRRRAEFISPIPKPRKHKGSPLEQSAIVFDEAASKLGTEGQKYDLTEIINGVRIQVDRWRKLPNPKQWRVSSETARLLQHWRRHRFNDIRPFFCQIEAVETVIWLTEVAPQAGATGRRFLDHLASANIEVNTGLQRLALKLATGGRQDHCYGDVDSLANHQRCTAATEQAVYARFFGGHARYHHQGSPARPATERPGQLLSEPRTGSERHAA